MIDKPLRVLSAVSLLILSLACATLTDVKATPTPEYQFEPVTTPLRFEPESLPKGQAGAKYEADIRIRDNVTPLSSVFISGGTLPAGLEFEFTAGADGATISGTPEETGTFTITVFVSCFGTMVSGQTGQMEYTIIIE